jgi:hypothetical protein
MQGHITTMQQDVAAVKTSKQVFSCKNRGFALSARNQLNCTGCEIEVAGRKLGFTVIK